LIAVTQIIFGRKSMKRILKWVATLLAVAFLALGTGIGVYAWRSVPNDNMTHVVNAKIGETTITLDSNGIPTIDAKSERDLAFAVGFMHARDRLWQLEMHRRVGRGQLAEVLGPKALDTDKFLRTLGIHKSAAAQLAAFPDEDKALLQAYADGVNSYVRDSMSVRPPEFVILGVQPGQWEPVDTVAWTLMMAWDLGGNWGTELLRLQLAAKMPLSRINQIVAPQVGDALVKHSDYTQLYKTLDAYPTKTVSAVNADTTVAELMYLSDGVEAIGSNNWVVNGANTLSGKPLLANDPHLSLAAPAIWYYAKLKAPGIEVTGATLPGAPSVVLGRTKGVAWGFTNTGPDVQDLYIEEINEKGEARTPDGWRKLVTYNETIKVKGEADVTINVRQSRHGPIVSDVHVPTKASINTAKYGIAMRWTALDADNTTALASRKINRAQTVADVREALKTYVAPQQNMVLADTLGNTAFIAAGRVPVRKADNDINGLAPSPGWDAKYDWSGWIPFDQLPQQTVTHFLATANQRIHGNDYPHYVASEWSHPGRKQRIETLLAAKPKHDAQSLREIQHDLMHTHDMPLLSWTSKIKSTYALSASATEALSAFQRNPQVSSDSKGAILMWAWSRHATRALFADDLGEPLFDAIYGRRDFRVALNHVAETSDEHWCDNIKTPAKENCESVFADSLNAALSELQTLYGSDISKWRWDTAHNAKSEHRPFSNVPLLAKLFEIRTPTAGDTYSVMVGKLRLKDPEPYLNDFAASMRAVYDLSVADANAVDVIYSTGQSGNPFSTHYRDLAKRWGSGGAGAYMQLSNSQPAGTLQLRGQPR
jgi:penicillin G amidase